MRSVSPEKVSGPEVEVVVTEATLSMYEVEERPLTEVVWMS
jgi:hypothetical protein